MGRIHPDAVLPSTALAFRHRGLSDLQEAQAVFVAAPRAVLWRSLVAVLPRAIDTAFGRRLARATRAVPERATGSLPESGATLPGFRVDAAVADHELVLAGEHRYSRYALGFHLSDAPEGSRLVAATFAAFPSRAGRAYRWIVVQPFHGGVVRRILAGAKRHAERSAPPRREA